MLCPTWAQIDLRAFASNFLSVRSIVPKRTQIMAVVKADAYGHGGVRIGKHAVESGADQLAVATLDEALELRGAGIQVPILVLGTIMPNKGAVEAVKNGVAISLCTMEVAKALSQAAQRICKPALAHLKIDTGMSRIGVQPSEAAGFMNNVKGLPGLTFKGIFSHFATADESDNPYALKQFNRFMWTIATLEKEGHIFPIRHIANSAAILNWPETHLDMVRPGCILYGSWPSERVHKRISLRPTFALKSQIIYLKEVFEGVLIGYGATYKTASPIVLATIPIGYADGYRRDLSNKATVLVRGMRCPIVGRICMDQCMVDVSHVPGVSIGDEVVLVGTQGFEEISSKEIARLLDTLEGEVFCGIGKRIPRVYIH